MIKDFNSEILVISSYPPRECGIATYTDDLITNINQKFSGSFNISVCALEENDIYRGYSGIVKYILEVNKEDEYKILADKINEDEAIKMVLIQHEFGLFGGEYGNKLLILLKNLKKPVIISFHTVLPGPNPILRQTVIDIVDNVQEIIAMTKNSINLLINDYGISKDKINMIPHGTHAVCFDDRQNMKKKFKLEDRSILSTFGLLGRNKSIETTLDALPQIVAKFPKVIFLIIGKTHPGVVKEEGEQYREFLEQKVKELNLTNNVRFINRYLESEEIIEYLKLTSIYLFTTKDPNQAVSGTFAYAMACGCPIVSTPIPHAKEFLSDDAGILFDFENSQQLADAVIKLLSDTNYRRNMSVNALHKINYTVWENVALKHTNLFEKYFDNEEDLKYNLPPISLDQISRMTNTTGISQFSKINTPNPESGYALDDNARALILITLYHKLRRSKENIRFIETYLNFIEKCQQEDGTFLNYIDKDLKFTEQNYLENLEDSNGRAIWSIGFFIANQNLMFAEHVEKAENIIKKAIPNIKNITSPRAISFIIKGLYHYNSVKKDENISILLNSLASKLLVMYSDNNDNINNWNWFEDKLTYANSVLPQALLYSYLATNNDIYKNIAKKTFDFLLMHNFKSNRISIICNDGWLLKGGEQKNEYGEQPIDVCYTILALDLFYKVFRDDEYKNKISIAFSWFLGNNPIGQTVYNSASGGCYDGIEEHGVNLNQGAESTIVYNIARLVMEIENYK